MDPSIASTFGMAALLALVQGLAAIPWLASIDADETRARIGRPKTWLTFVAVVLAGAAVLTAIMLYRSDPSKLEFDGRIYAAILQLQLTVDLLIIIIAVMLFFWPKGGTVAMAAFREGYRQPMFWLITGGVVIMLFVSMVIPYFTFGEDFKMMKQLSFDMIKLATLLFAVLAASISVSEEIEGRTAVTLMSKPVTRRHFLLGKFIGILLAAGAMTLILGWFQNWALYLKPHFEKLEDSFDPLSVAVQRVIEPMFSDRGFTPEGRGFLRGVGLWYGETLANLCGLSLGFGLVMIMLAIATALATRLPMIVSMNICLLFFLLGNLAPILAQVSESASKRAGGAMNLVNFLAQMLDKLMPSLSFFSTDQVFFRETYLSPMQFGWFVLSVLGYAAIWAIVALLAGLFLFEDRDLA